MTISPFTVYLVMQADSIKTVAVGFATITGFAAVITTVFKYFGRDQLTESEVAAMDKWQPRVAMATVALAVLAAALPPTKTLAAMIIVPAIANSDAIQKDVPEIYELAKDRLKEALK